MTNSTQAQGFGIIPNWLVRESDISAYALLTYIALSGRANKNGECWPSLRLVAREARCSQSTARRAIKELQRIGIIQVTGRVRKSDGGQTSNVYRVLVGRTNAPLSDGQGPAFTETPQEQDTSEQDISKKLKSTLTSGRVSSHSSTVTASEAQIRFLADCFILLHQSLPDRHDYGQWEVMSSAQAHSDINEYWSEIEHGGESNLEEVLTEFEDHLSPRALTFINKRLGLVAS